MITNNRISGAGYTPVAGDSPYVRFIDADPSVAANLRDHNNRCTDGTGSAVVC